jgi:phage gpG-like protein
MDIKKLTKKLSKARDDIVKNQEISPEMKQVLESVVMKELDNEKKPTPFESKTVTGRILTDEQHYRLRLIEKTGTGSTAIH